MTFPKQTIPLEKLETEAARLSNGFYWTVEWCVAMVVCYCVMGLFGLIFLPVAIYFPAVGVPLALAWYGAWFIAVPRMWRRHAAGAIIEKYHSKARSW